MLSSQETLDITGRVPVPDEMGFLDIDDSNYTDLTNIGHRNESQAHTDTPEAGIDTYDIAEIAPEVIEEYAERGANVGKLSAHQTQLYIEDGMPPNGDPYTEGVDLPTNGKDGEYHRLIYTEGNIPTRLYRFSAIKNRWVYCETDRRQMFNKQKPSLTRMIMDESAVPTSNATGETR
jgi:hypothetical protein